VATMIAYGVSHMIYSSSSPPMPGVCGAEALLTFGCTSPSFSKSEALVVSAP